MDAYIETQYFVRTLTTWESGVFLLLLPFGFLFGRLTFGLYVKAFVPDFSVHVALVERDNKAVAVGFAGFEAAIGLVMWGALSDLDQNNVTNLYSAIVWCFIGFLFLLLAAFINDQISWRGLRIAPAMHEGNIAAGVVAAGSYIAAGFVSLYTIGGGVDKWGEAIGSAVLYFVLCQLEFTAFLYIVRFVMGRILDKDVMQLVVERNLAAGVYISLANIALAIIATNPLKNTEELLAFVVWFVLACPILLLFTVFANYVILSGIDVQSEFEKGRWACAAVLGSTIIATSLSILGFMEGSCSYTAAKTTTLAERLVTTNNTMLLLRWPNLVLLGCVFLYTGVSKIVFSLPHILFPVKSRSIRDVDPEDIAALKEVEAEAKSKGMLGMIRNFLKIPAKYRLAAERKRRQLDLAGGPTVQALNPPSLAPNTTSGIGTADPYDVLAHVAASDAAALGPSASTQFFDNLARASGDVEMISLPRAVAYCGYVVSIGILIRSSFSITNGSGQPTLDIIFYSLYWLALGAIMQHVGYYGQRAVLWGRDAPSSETNLAAAIIDMCTYIGVAMQVGSNLLRNGEAGQFDIANETIGSVIFFLIQMALLAIAGWVYRLITKFDDVSAIRSGNTAVAVCNGLTSIAFAALAMQPTTRTQELLSLCGFFIIGVIVLQVNRATLINKLIMVSQDLDKEIIDDRNWGAALTEGAITVLLAYSYGTFLREVCLPPVTLIMGNVTATNTLAPTPTLPFRQILV